MSELTVVIPTHNRVEVLGDCLRAVAAATPDGETIEVVVVDDGSTDQTRQLLAKAYPQVRVLHFEHARGPAAARNAGIAAADGPWCLIINDDTILDSAALGVFLAYRRGLARREVSVIGNIAPWPEQITAFEHWCSHGGSQFTHARIPPERYEDAGEDQFVTSNILVERDLLLAHPFDESFRYARYEDRELGYRLARRSGHRIHYLPAARSYHCHRLGFAEWLGKWKTFGAAAIHFASLYPEDTELRRALSIERAERTESFRSQPCSSRFRCSTTIISGTLPCSRMMISQFSRRSSRRFARCRSSRA